jgi:hypothetical protein
MKTIILPLLALGGALALASPMSAKDSADVVQEKATLQLQIELPPEVDLFYERDVAEALSYHVTETFRRRGYEGRVEDVFHADDAKPGRAVLALNLIRWERSATGFVDCTFTAEVRRADGSVVRLGIFSGTDSSMGGRRWDVRDAFEGAARNAADQLWSTLMKRDLLPAFAA